MTPTRTARPAPLALAVRVAALALLLPTALAAQEGHAGHEAHAAHAPSPYADMTERAIKALSAEEVAGLRDGAGLGMALPAELNGWPGPKHVLELADALELTADQGARIEDVRAAMERDAKALGMRLIEAERALDELFAGGSADAESVRAATARAAALRGELRAVHLVAHLATREILSPEQVTRYARLRGYAPR